MTPNKKISNIETLVISKYFLTQLPDCNGQKLQGFAASSTLSNKVGLTSLIIPTYTFIKCQWVREISRVTILWTYFI